ncbi:heme-binding protein [Akkermansiaceae bacterium]|nr:heme-binding protein [Akkermansiaceae bacterium]
MLFGSLVSLEGQGLTVADVQAVIAQSVQESLAVSPDRLVAVVDREGFVLGVWDVNGGAQPSATDVARVVSTAGAAAFLSSNQHAFTTRTAGFIIQQNFPPGVVNRPNGPLVGVNFSSMAFSDTNKYKAPEIDNSFPVPPVPGVSDLASATPADAFRSVPFTALALSGNPGGVPLFKNGILVGGVGVVGYADAAVSGFDTSFLATDNERIALSGQAGFRPAPVFDGSNVLIDGIRLAYLVNTGSDATVADPAAFLANPANGQAVALADIDGMPASSDDGAVDYSPKASPAPAVYPNPFGLVGVNGIPGQLRSAIRADPLPGTIAGVARLSAAEVESILRLAAERSEITRAGIRLPRGQVARVWISVVSNPASNGVEPAVLGTYRTPDATIFSWDVAIQKARTALFFSRGLERGAPRAFSCRAVGFLSQSMFPPGILGTPPGPLEGLQLGFSVKDLGGAVGTRVPSEAINPNVPNGITIFPGGFPLYRGGVLVGAIGVSGDGIEQDDLVGAAGARDFLAPAGSRSDDMVYERARIPYAKFPRAASSF